MFADLYSIVYIFMQFILGVRGLSESLQTLQNTSLYEPFPVFDHTFAKVNSSGSTVLEAVPSFSLLALFAVEIMWVQLE